MRLTAIKLAGFKSFVDPTTFSAPSNLTGIVGPNGCGKSNIIDAIRWVMGEGSAKVLRGESMSDVIFSGSSGRKPVGTATVELLFDNSDGRVGGQFAAYTEIAVKRQVSRDGVSMYLLNGTRCRRKDIRDLFLGTGLGSRSYSIIEQGMISEIVDAKPEDIRAHLEEAAGISKYKERRRETENRIARTRDNLARLSDLREEVGKHLGRLKRQSYAANRYTRLQQEKRELESRLLALRWREMKQRSSTGSEGLSRQETALQKSIASQRAAETALEKLHEKQGQASEEFNKVQGGLYEVGSEIARLEQTIAHARELQQRQQQEFEETQSALADLEKHMSLDQAQVEDLTQSLAEVEPALRIAEKKEATATAALAKAEEEVGDWQQAFELHHAASTRCSSEADQVRTEVEVLDQRILHSDRRLEALGKESGGIDTSKLGGEVTSLQKEVESLREQETSQTAELDTLREETRSLDKLREDILSEKSGVQRSLHTAEGKLESLITIQSAALEEGVSSRWLKSLGLSGASPLAKQIEVENGWEAAVETVLGRLNPSASHSTRSAISQSAFLNAPVGRSSH
jgi:chromosome segregation protein